MKKISEKFQGVMDSMIIPFANKFGANKSVRAISTGLMYTLPLTLGASIFSILAAFPITSINKWLVNTGLSSQFNSVMGGTLNIIALLISFSIPYSYTKLLDKPNTNPLMSAFISVSSFVILMPQTVGEENLSALSYDYLGSSAMFVAIILGLVISRLYVRLSQSKRLIIKMPEGIPPMVSQSFEPIIIAVIILIGVVMLRIGMSYTTFGNVFNIIQYCVANPLAKLASSVPLLIIIGSLANLLFFFGIHPNAINSAMTPILMTMALANVKAFTIGGVLPYKTVMIVNAFLNNDAVGSTLSLLIAILLVCKSKRYRTFSKMAVLPNFFNVNEPVVFGLPIMLNPILLIPFALSTVITGVIGYLGTASGFISYYNPVLALGLAPLWTIPKVFTAFFVMGWQGLVLRLVAMVVMVLVYLPFVKILDKAELSFEKTNVILSDQKL